MATAKGLRSLSRLRGRVGVGVLPRFTLFVSKEFPPPASHHSRRCDLPRKRERCSKCADRPIQPKIIPALARRRFVQQAVDTLGFRKARDWKFAQFSPAAGADPGESLRGHDGAMEAA